MSLLSHRLRGALGAAFVVGAACAHAAPPPHARGPAFPPSRVVTGPVHLDQRHRHDHYYPAAGFTVGTLPANSLSIGWRDGNWFFHMGVWYRMAGTRFVVAVPPAGIVVPYLPPAVVPLWIGGAPYYYANGTYYAPAGDGYAVVLPPAGAESAQPAPLPPTFIAYPRNGQSSAQAESDRSACNQWAGAQPGAERDASVFQRAFEACMDGRGYTVR